MSWIERRSHKHNIAEQQGLETRSKELLNSKAKVSSSGNDVTFP